MMRPQPIPPSLGAASRALRELLPLDLGFVLLVAPPRLTQIQYAATRERRAIMALLCELLERLRCDTPASGSDDGTSPQASQATLCMQSLRASGFAAPDIVLLVVFDFGPDGMMHFRTTGDHGTTCELLRRWIEDIPVHGPALN